MTRAIVAEHLTKTFAADTVAVNDLSFTVRPHTVTALLGPNGAGKTTTISMCEGFTSPTSGQLTVLGLNPARHGDELRSRIGIMLQGGGAYPGIRTREMLALAASYSANPLDVDWLLGVVGLTEVARTTYRGLSGGQQQRLSLACALVGRPELVFLDEPSAGLDAGARHLVWELIKSLRRDGVTVILTTHYLDEAETLADDVLIINHGQLVASGSPDDLRETVMAERTHRTEITATRPLSTEDIAALTASIQLNVTTDSAAGTQTSADGHTVTLPVEPTSHSFALLAQTCNDRSIPLTAIRAVRPSLEDIFLATIAPVDAEIDLASLPEEEKK